MSPRTLPAAVLMPEYEALLREGAELPLVVSGESMLPFLRPGRDTVYLKKPEAPLQRGDIAFYRRFDGSYILHRVFRAEPGKYWFLGDAQTRVEGPLPAQCVFARVTAVRRGQRLIHTGSRFWRLFSGPWLALVRQRPRLLRIYRLFYHSSQ
jgi:hypothetical protein